MPQPVSRERLGGILLEKSAMYAWLDPKAGPFERKSCIVFVDPQRFMDFWSTLAPQTTTGHTHPPSVTEWPILDRQVTIGRLLSGPRRPFAIPHVYDCGTGVAVGASLQARLMLDWGAQIFPVIVAPEFVDMVREETGLRRVQVMPGNKFLDEAQEVIRAFQKGIPLPDLYDPEKPPTAEKMRIDLEDYASLIHFQLESILLRHHLYKQNDFPVSDADRDGLLLETRTYLYRQEVVGYALSKGAVDPQSIPRWTDTDMVSPEVARRFLATNTFWNRAPATFRLHSIPETGARLTAEEPQAGPKKKRPTEPPAHLKLVGKEQPSGQ